MTPRVYLDSLIHLGQKFGLETVQCLSEALNHPERVYPTVVIAGTNGKGSVVAYLDAALRRAGRRVGRYTSPHLIRVNERIAVDGRPIGDAALDTSLDRVRRAADRLQALGQLSAPPTYFETLTTAAFEHFRTEDVDLAIVEVGMGGRLDATNIADPLVSAIVSIDFDHEAYLGKTLAAIAGEKAGVMRAGRPTVVGPMAEDARATIEARGRAIGAPVVIATQDTRWIEDADGLHLETPEGVYRHLRPLPGRHQRDNLLVAVRVLEALASPLSLDRGQAAAGLAHAEWPGRLQSIEGDVPLLLDGAHNAAGARALAAFLATLRAPLLLVFGAMRDKAFAEMAHTLFPLAREVVVTQPRIARAATVDEIFAATADIGVPRHAAADVAEALRIARERAHRGECVVVAGSLYLVGEVLALLEGAPR